MNLGFETCGNATLIAYDAGIPRASSVTIGRSRSQQTKSRR
jgi:hypothetical protein